MVLSRREPLVRGELTYLILHALLQIGPANDAELHSFLVKKTLLHIRPRFVEVRLHQLVEKGLVVRVQPFVYDLPAEVRQRLQEERRLWTLRPGPEDADQPTA